MTERPPSLIEQTRRRQLLAVTISLVAERGYPGTSLQRIADGAGITKAAVLYHFPSKDAVISAAQEHVIAQLVEHVGTAVDAADAAHAPAAYVREMVAHLRRHPDHARMIMEAGMHGDSDSATADRWGPLAALLAGAYGGGTNADALRSLAIIVGGAIDAIVVEQTADPQFDSAAAAGLLVEMMQFQLSAHGH